MAAAKPHKEELLMLYEVTVSDLAYFKTQQWSVTNYALLVLAGLIGVASFLESMTCIDRIVLIALEALVSIASAIVLYKLQCAIKIRQSRLTAIRDNFSEVFKSAWSAEPKGQEYVHSIYFLYGANLAGLSLAIWLIGFRL